MRARALHCGPGLVGGLGVWTAGSGLGPIRPYVVQIQGTPAFVLAGKSFEIKFGLPDVFFLTRNFRFFCRNLNEIGDQYYNFSNFAENFGKKGVLLKILLFFAK
jgi:hypothetical protein